MSFRQDNSWSRGFRTWKAEHRALINASGLPEIVVCSREHWEHYLDQCFYNWLIPTMDQLPNNGLGAKTTEELTALKALLESWPGGAESSAYTVLQTALAER